MMRKVVSHFFFICPSNHACDKTVPESSLAPNSDPGLKPNPEPKLDTNEDLEEEIDPIAMLAALPKASRQRDRFNPRLSPIREDDVSEGRLSEHNIARNNGWDKRLKKQIMCMNGTQSGDKHKVDNGDLEGEKPPVRIVIFIFNPKFGALLKPNHSLGALSMLSHSFGAFSKPNRRFSALSKPNHCLSPDIINSLKILKVRYRGGPRSGQDKELVLTWHKKEAV